MRLPDDAVRYIDLPDVSETFADSVGLVTFDGQSARIELCVTRMDMPQTPKKPTGRRYPVCRMVMPPDAFIGLYNSLENLIRGLEQQGVLKRGEPPKKPPFVQ